MLPDSVSGSCEPLFDEPFSFFLGGSGPDVWPVTVGVGVPLPDVRPMVLPTPWFREYVLLVQQLASRARLVASARALLIKPKLLAKKLRPDGAKCAPIPRVRGNAAAPRARRPRGSSFLWLPTKNHQVRVKLIYLRTDYGAGQGPAPPLLQGRNDRRARRFAPPEPRNGSPLGFPARFSIPPAVRARRNRPPACAP